MKRHLAFAAAALAGVAAASSASATIVTSLPGGIAVAIPADNRLAFSGPATFGPGITFTTTASSAYGYTGLYGFSGNGNWSGTSMIGLDAGAGTFTLSFAEAVSGFVAEINWSIGSTADDAWIAAYDTSGQLLESLTLENAGGNAVAPGFHGFSYAGNTIGSIRFSHEYIGIRNLSLTGVPAVPEPATWAMLTLGLGAVGATLRRRKARAPVAIRPA